MTRRAGPTSPALAEVHALTTANRLLLADVLDGLIDEQWYAETLCAGWDVRHLAAHLVQPFLIGFPRFVVEALRHRGDTDATVDALARRLARRPRHELVHLLRHHAGDRLDPPRVGAMGPFVDTCVHLRDLARPLRLDVDVDTAQWVRVLNHLTSPEVAPALVRAGRLDGLQLVASDAEWRAGTGPRAEGRLEALALAATGRRAALEDLDGPGARVLASRLGVARDDGTA